ncbi:hypothetical protein D3C74_271150 [compost metagenome]
MAVCRSVSTTMIYPNELTISLFRVTGILPSSKSDLACLGCLYRGSLGASYVYTFMGLSDLSSNGMHTRAKWRRYRPFYWTRKPALSWFNCFNRLIAIFDVQSRILHNLGHIFLTLIVCEYGLFILSVGRAISGQIMSCRKNSIFYIPHICFPITVSVYPISPVLLNQRQARFFFIRKLAFTVRSFTAGRSPSNKSTRHKLHMPLGPNFGYHRL